MTVKPTGDGDEDTTDTMAERIRAVQEEPWRKMAYVDEDSQEAWESFSESLFVEETDTAPKLRSSMSPAVYMDTVSAPRAPEKLAKLNLMRKRGLA
jgi:DNA-directed RNA polymerase-3 subunit RPC5